MRWRRVAGNPPQVVQGRGNQSGSRDSSHRGAAVRAITVALIASAVFTTQAFASDKAACTAPAPGYAACMSLVRTDVKPRPETRVQPNTPPTGFGYGPSDLQSAYNVASQAAANGGSATVALVDAYDDPNAASDLATYRSAWGLPACGTGCFQKLNQNGLASPLPAASGSSGWATEESLDLDMVSAICPNCHIILVEANSASLTNLGTAVDSAVTAGAQYISNSYGSDGESSGETTDDSFYNHPGTVITASAGDNGYYSGGVIQVNFPAVSPYVTAVGGTALTRSTNSRGWTESVWGSSSANSEGTGSGCSEFETKPSWQPSSDQCSNRENNDVSAVADPNTGLAVYDTYDQGGWLEVGGTSAASPIIASVYALAGLPVAGTYPSSYPYLDPAGLNDVTSGANGTCTSAIWCTAESGYDGPTGLGTPNGVAAFTGAIGTATTLGSSANPSVAGQAVTLTATVANQGSGGGPTGSVTFKEGGVALGGPVPLSGNQATLTTDPLAGGSHSITATYSGDGTHLTSSSSTLAQVVAGPPTAAIASPGNGRRFSLGQSVPTTFSCSEGALGPGLSACDDSGGVSTVGGGSGKLDTSKAGVFIYSVAAASADGGVGFSSITYTVSKAPTAIVGLFVSPSGVSATLKRADTGGSLAGQKLVFAAGSRKLCTATTNSRGKAACASASAVAWAAMHLSYAVSFYGSVNYVASSAGKSTKKIAKQLIGHAPPGVLNGVSGLKAELRKVGHPALVSEVNGLRRQRSHTVLAPTLF
jgi:hypothetical protein